MGRWVKLYDANSKAIDRVVESLVRIRTCMLRYLGLRCIAGNLEIAAASACCDVVIAIHQVDTPVFVVAPAQTPAGSGKRNQRTLHISLHNGDSEGMAHYNSVRLMDSAQSDRTQRPGCPPDESIHHVDILTHAQSDRGASSLRLCGGLSLPGLGDRADQCDHSAAQQSTAAIEAMVMRGTGCENVEQVRRCMYIHIVMVIYTS